MAENIYAQINALNGQVAQLYQQGDYERALSLARKAYDLTHLTR
jgi:hypothetical protein